MVRDPRGVESTFASSPASDPEEQKALLRSVADPFRSVAHRPEWVADQPEWVADQSGSLADKFLSIADEFRSIDDRFVLRGDGFLSRAVLPKAIAGRSVLKLGLSLSIACLEGSKEAGNRDIKARLEGSADLQMCIAVALGCRDDRYLARLVRPAAKDVGKPNIEDD
jgi:hypothetical protein